MCFETLIGIRNSCEESVPKSGLYVDDYGVTLNELDQIITADYSTGYDLFASKRQAAGELISSEVQARLAQWLVGDTIIDGSKIGYLQQGISGYNNALGAGNYVGATMRLRAEESFANIYLSDVFIATETNVATTLYVVDLYTNKVIDSFQVNTNELTRLELTLYSNRNDLWVALLYESTENYQPTLVKRGYCGNCNGRNAEVYSCRLVMTQGFQGTIFSGMLTSGQGFGYTGGLQVNFTVNCDRRAWICSNAQMFALAHVFRTNAEIMQFAMYESINIRANTTVTINAESVQKRYEYYMSQYEKQMNIVLQNMAIPNDTNCFRCRMNQRWSSIIP